MNGRAAAARVTVLAGVASMLVMGSVTGPASATAAATDNATQSPQAAAVFRPPPGWVRREGRYFIYWLPNNRWQAVENANGLSISSPTGDVVVEFGYVTSLPGPVTPKWVINYTARAGGLDLHPLVNYRFTAWSPVTTTKLNYFSRITSQNATWTGVRNHRLKGRQNVRGWISADAYNNTWSFGWSGYTMVAPATSWQSNLTLMQTIRTNIKFMGRR